MACSLTIKWQMIKGRKWSVCQAFVEGPFFGRLCRKHFNMVSHTSPHLCLLKTYQKLGKAGWMAEENWPRSMCLHKANSWVWTEGRKDYHGPSHCSCEENSKTALAVLTLSVQHLGRKDTTCWGHPASPHSRGSQRSKQKKCKKQFGNPTFSSWHLKYSFAMPIANRMHNSVCHAEHKWHPC